MSKKRKDELNDDLGLTNDMSADDLSDVKEQLKKLKKSSADPDEDEAENLMTEEDNSAEVAEAVSEDIVVHEDFALPFNEEDRYYKSLDKFKKESQNKE